jgi:hypothetical protein
VVFKFSFVLGVKVALVSTAQTKLGLLRRIVVAAVLVLALLSGLVPFGAASAGHLCTMECCAALPPHTAGSCHMSAASHGELQQDLDKHCGLPETDNGTVDGIVAGVMGMTDSPHSSDLDDITIEASDHCKNESQSQNLNGPSPNDSPDLASIGTQSFSKPCPPECGTGALSTGVRRSGDSLAIAGRGYAQLPTPRLKVFPFHNNSLITSAYCRQLRLRGPPTSFT